LASLLPRSVFLHTCAVLVHSAGKGGIGHIAVSTAAFHLPGKGAGSWPALAMSDVP
jgi:hypothetical protein